VLYVNSQVGDDLVTNPQAYSLPEESFIMVDSDPLEHYVFYESSLAPGRSPLLGEEHLEQLHDALPAIRDHFESLYSPPEGERFAMEIEFKVTAEGDLAIKQARPWIFPGQALGERWTEQECSARCPTRDNYGYGG
jgi:hypothetical protein